VTAETATPAQEKTQRRKAVGRYDYTNENGELLFQVVRFEPKAFRQRRFDPEHPKADRNGWVWGLGDTRRVLYRLPDVVAAAQEGWTLFVVEGEKDVHALEAAGDFATCAPMGAGKWRSEYAESLRGAHVIVVADRDEPGRAHARDVRDSLIGIASGVEVVEPAEGNDAFDHLAAGFTTNDFVPVDLAPKRRTAEDGGLAPTWDELLSRAVDKAGAEGRNNACVWLVLQLRDHQFEQDEARQVVARFQATVSGTGGHSFPRAEAMEVFDKLFFTEPRPPWGQAAPDSFACTDYGNAERLVARHGADLRYVHAWKSWLVWDGSRWKPDATDEVERRAKETTRAMFRAAADVDDDDRRRALALHARKSESGPRLTEMVKRARSEPGVPIEPGELDRDRMALCVRNGIVDLRTGELHEHDRAALHTKQAPINYRADAAAPTWERFLREIMPSAEDRAFLQRAVGYSLTGDVSEHVLFVLHGTGQNGKSVFLEAIRAAMGDYAQQAPPELIVARRGGGVPADVARLHGARFVTASETEDGSRLAESLVKQLTGGDRVVARRLYADFFEFDPTHKIWLATNHKPQVFGSDEAIWRRIRLVPFEVTIPKDRRDKRLAHTLRTELPGIVAWAVEGCLEWQRYGLGESTNVLAATAEYRSESDVFGAFLEDTCVVGEAETVAAQSLYQEYEIWASNSNLRPMSMVAFGRKLAERGFKRDRQGKANVRVWRGVGLANRGTGGKLRLVHGGDES
jgi:P4 family phage/plasmid primase-like protien